ncbi:hypothetical protein SAMN05421858_5100 [Haladaptatus litoreus]|uniref:Uncharacterized protein n=1 Tax=Haladaptatus litoreus TaxID=553468 RepID=A0A1N7FIV9_9EURY|nr:hypothetical protein [Haladaptatus litoreus]SIS00156.1 hypothetical protein SAMN05421858_5100 [Haladaptatus litoreus]
MSLSTNRDNGRQDVGRDTGNFLTKNWRSLVGIVEQENPVELTDFDSIDRALWLKMSRHGIIKKTDDYDPKSRTWNVSENARSRLEHYRDVESKEPEGTLVCPYCHQRAFVNLRGAGYQCQNPQCEREFEEFHEVGSDDVR